MLQAPRAFRWSVPVATFSAWTLVALSAAYWGFRMADASGSAALAPPARVQAEPVEPAQVARLLGAMPAEASAAAAAPSAASRFQLTGVVAGLSGAGAALISVDGAPPKPFTVGSRVDEGLVLQSVQGRRALLGAQPRGEAALTLEVPALPR